MCPRRLFTQKPTLAQSALQISDQQTPRSSGCSGLQALRCSGCSTRSRSRSPTFADSASTRSSHLQVRPRVLLCATSFVAYIRSLWYMCLSSLRVRRFVLCHASPSPPLSGSTGSLIRNLWCRRFRASGRAPTTTHAAPARQRYPWSTHLFRSQSRHFPSSPTPLFTASMSTIVESDNASRRCAL